MRANSEALLRITRFEQALPDNSRDQTSKRQSDAMTAPVSCRMAQEVSTTAKMTNAAVQYFIR